MAPKQRPYLFAFLALLVIGVDAASKWAVYHSLPLGGPPLRVIGDFVRLTYIHNAGAAFGLFQGSRWFFVGVSILSIVVILALALGGRYRGTAVQIAFGLILGGAIGNLVDRLWLGVVIDFIQIGVGGWYWPIFNVADIGVTVGVALLALGLFREGGGEEERHPGDENRSTSAGSHPGEVGETSPQ